MANAKNHDYQILPPSIWPVVGAIAAFIMLFGAVMGFHGQTGSFFANYWLFLIGVAGVLFVMYGWWSDVVHESNSGEHTPVVRIGLRYGIIIFIMSEVMFFAAWFWAFFKNAMYPMGPESPRIDGIWPPAGIETFDPWHLPLINTLILLTSGATLTWAHHVIATDGDRNDAKKGLWLTVLLGLLFTIVQAYEYSHAAFGFTDGIYPSVFFMATGFHGFHVAVGTIFLAVCLIRVYKGHFTAEAHVGLEGAAWYWHFVDVVWLFLFFVIYVWGS